MSTKSRKYYSSRVKGSSIDFEILLNLVKHTFDLFRKKDYFKEKLGITWNDIPEHAISQSTIALREKIFPIDEWLPDPWEEEKIFDLIEFLYDNISKPGDFGNFATDTGFNYTDYMSYDTETGQQELRDKVNMFLCDYGKGFELSFDGEILELATYGLEEIVNADLPTFDKENVEDIVKNAVRKFRSRSNSLEDKKSATKDLADVLEFLREKLKSYEILSKSQDSALFEIANKYTIRHHKKDQYNHYEKSIWYTWIFHSYLATVHAGIRLIKKYEKQK